MKRFGVLSIVLAAVVTVGCGGADSAGSSPTAPSPATPPASQPQPQPQAPASCVPQNLRVASIQGTAVRLEWSGVSGASEYLVLVGSAPGSSDQLFTNTGNPYYAWTAKQGRQYARVQAKCNGQYGTSSNEVEYTVG
jgi:hypothetical protein